MIEEPDPADITMPAKVIDSKATVQQFRKMPNNPSMNSTAALAACTLVQAAISAKLHADTFGSGANSFTIEFVAVGNAGNANNAGAVPLGGVPYRYRIGTYEISQDVVARAVAGGLTNVSTGPWTGAQPAGNVTWPESAAFVNFLNTNTGYHSAYNLNSTATEVSLWSSQEAWQAGGENLYRHRDAFYFLPSEDEWYKAAYHGNDGATANYWGYATSSDAAPIPVLGGTAAGTAVYNLLGTAPASVFNAGGLSPYGTMGQNGNVAEWTESNVVETNHALPDYRGIFGGSWIDSGSPLTGLTALRVDYLPSDSFFNAGFRVASLPEPAAAALMLGAGVLQACRRRRSASS